MRTVSCESILSDSIKKRRSEHELEKATAISFGRADGRALACEAWLGPGYQITAQTNVVKPGGKPQQPHRDYRELSLPIEFGHNPN